MSLKKWHIDSGIHFYVIKEWTYWECHVYTRVYVLDGIIMMKYVYMTLKNWAYW